MSRTDKLPLDEGGLDSKQQSRALGSDVRPMEGRSVPGPDWEDGGRGRLGPAGATLAMSKPYKRCRVCGRIFPTRRQYLLETEPVRNNPDYPDGHMPAVGDDEYYFELRNCPCGTTLAEKLKSERDLTPLGQLRRNLFADLMDGYVLRYGLDRRESRRRVMERYEPFFRAHVRGEEVGRNLDDETVAPLQNAPAGRGSESARFAAMLSRRGMGAGQDTALDESIWEEYGKVRALFVLDSSGFSRRTKSQGIVHFLALIQDMRERVFPILDRHGAESRWSVADNVIAVFPDADSAFRAALATQRNMRIVNAGRRETDRIEVCIGLGFGRVLVIGGEDVFGDEMNLASKLGEDVAGPGQILLTQEAYLGAEGALDGIDVVERRITVSGVEIAYFEVNVLEP